MMLSIVALETAAAACAEVSVWAATKTVIESFAHRVLVVDGNALYLCRRNGTWLDASKPGAVATATLGAMLKEHFPYGSWSGRVIEHVRTSLLSVMEDPGRHGISRARLDDFDRAPIFALKDGGSIDARTLKILDADATARYLLLDRNVSGVDFRPALLDADANHPGPRLAAHFEADRDKPTYSILKRVGYQLLGPHKAIDTITMPEPDAGKTTIAAWVGLSLNGYVITVDAINLLSTQGTRFTALQRRLSKYRLVFLDECDKLRTPLGPGDLNSLTPDMLTVEPKGEDSFEIPRRGNSIFLGAAPPAVELGQGGKERLAWAFDGSCVPKMRAELRELIHDPEAQAWLATFLLKWASDAYMNKNDAADDKSRAAAEAIHAARADPLQLAVGDFVEKCDGSFLPNAELKGRLNLGYPDIPSDVPAKALAKAMQATFGVSSIATSRGGQSVRGYQGLRLK